MKFDLQDFGDIIPGHGGIMDRFDCQFLMATFVNAYIHSFIRTSSPNGKWLHLSIFILKTYWFFMNKELIIRILLFTFRPSSEDTYIETRRSAWPLLCFARFIEAKGHSDVKFKRHLHNEYVEKSNIPKKIKSVLDLIVFLELNNIVYR